MKRWPACILIALVLSACGGGGGDSSGGNTPPPGGNNPPGNNNPPPGNNNPPPGGNNPPPAMTYSLGGTVSGLTGAGLVLQDGTGNQTSVSASGAFTLATGMQSGASYVVTVKTQPSAPAQSCSVTNGSGTIGSANVSDVAVSCSTLITTGNAHAVALIGNRVIESLTQVADIVGQRLTYLSTHLAPAVSENCPDPNGGAPGSIDYTFADTDQNAALSAGDVVTAHFNHCFLLSSLGTADLDLTLTLQAPPQPVDYASGFAATIGLISFPLTDETLDGTVDILYTDADEKRVVQGQVGAGGLRISVTVDGGDDTVDVISATGRKTINYVGAKYEVTASADFSSSALGGRFTLATPNALTGVLNVYPDQGLQEFKGAYSVLRYAAQGGVANPNLVAGLDATGSGSFATLAPIAWKDSVEGFFWWEPRSGPLEAGFTKFAIRTLDTWAMRLMSQNPAVITDVPLNAEIRLFFSGPVDTSQTISMSFEGQGASSGVPLVPADLHFNGAIVTVTPQQPLEPGASYELTTADGIMPSLWESPNPEESFALELTTTSDP
jgi:Bacterial Ig-like domain